MLKDEDVMKSIYIPLITIILLFAGCDGAESTETPEVTLADEIEDLAETYPNYPSDAETLDTEVQIGNETVNGTEATDVGTTNVSETDINITIPDSLAGRGLYSNLTIQIWINGTYIDIPHDGETKTVSTKITLSLGNNVLCAVITKDGKKYRSAIIHIYYLTVDQNLVARWYRTENDFDITGEDEGFEITADGKLYDLKLQSNVWTRTQVLAENITALNGSITSYDPTHPTADLFVSSYSLSNNNSHVIITESTNTIYGVKVE